MASKIPIPKMGDWRKPLCSRNPKEMKNLDACFLSQMKAPHSHWHGYASHWQKLRPPLRPHADDSKVYADELAPDCQTLLFGITPEIGALDLPGLAVAERLPLRLLCGPDPAA